MEKNKKINKFAVIQTGGKQYLVQEGESLRVEKLKGVKEGGAVNFDKILLVADEDNVKIGAPYVEGAKVTAKAEGEGRSKKKLVFKYKSKTRYRVKKGHKQTYSKIKIEKIESGK